MLTQVAKLEHALADRTNELGIVLATKLSLEDSVHQLQSQLKDLQAVEVRYFRACVMSVPCSSCPASCCEGVVSADRKQQGQWVCIRCTLF
jgi:hypothetical protein